MKDSQHRKTLVRALKDNGFELVRSRKHGSWKHPDGRAVVVGGHMNDRNLVKSIAKQAQIKIQL